MGSAPSICWGGRCETAVCAEDPTPSPLRARVNCNEIETTPELTVDEHLATVERVDRRRAELDDKLMLIERQDPLQAAQQIAAELDPHGRLHLDMEEWGPAGLQCP